jgi:hypothetical protein
MQADVLGQHGVERAIARDIYHSRFRIVPSDDPVFSRDRHYLSAKHQGIGAALYVQSGQSFGR